VAVQHTNAAITNILIMTAAITARRMGGKRGATRVVL